MKKLLILFLLYPIVGFSQIKVNEDSVNYYFSQIINEYRNQYNNQPLKLEPTLKPFSDYWSKYMYELKINESDSLFLEESKNHGFGDNSFYVRANKFSNGVHSENTIEPWNINETSKYLNQTCGSTNKDIAQFLFNSWKNSPKHNDAMLWCISKKFYLSVYIVGDTISVSYVGAGDIYKVKRPWHKLL